MKLIDLLNAGYDVQPGQIVTDKTCPPFKNSAQLAEAKKIYVTVDRRNTRTASRIFDNEGYKKHGEQSGQTFYFKSIQFAEDFTMDLSAANIEPSDDNISEIINEAKALGPDKIQKGKSYKIDGTNDVVTIVSVKSDKASTRHDSTQQSGDYAVAVKFNNGKSDKWYLDKSDTMFLPDTVNEVTYREFKNDDTLTTRQKVGEGIKEMNSLLFKMEQLIRQTSKLKSETGTNPDEYWKSTHRKMERVTKRVVKIAKYLQELKKENESN